MQKQPLILAVDPGSTSTKLALYRGDQVLVEDNLKHPAAELIPFASVAEQLDYRLNKVLVWLGEQTGSQNQSEYAALRELDLVVARGGFLHPVQSGVYAVNDDMLDDLRQARYGEHASNLGGLLARELASPFGIPAYIVDPIVVDELDDLARYSGLPEIPRRSQLHALNVRAVSHKVAADLGQELHESRFIVAHLGSGISVVAIRNGKMVDVNNANNEGPFSAERVGGLPTVDLIHLCFSGRYSERDLLHRVTKSGGLYAYFGTKDLSDLEQRIVAGDKGVEAVVNAMVYQIAKEIGAMATVLKGDVQRLILTGGMAHSAYLVNLLKDRVAFLAPVEVLPGEGELEALAAGGLNVVLGRELPLQYTSLQQSEEPATR